MTGVILDRVSKSFGRVQVIKGVDLDIRPNEFVVFVGPSGCGKSTLLRLVAGLEDVTAGTIAIGGEDVTELEPAERGIAMVFQSYALYPHMSVYENMAFGMRLVNSEQSLVDERVRTAATSLQIDHLLERKPKELSGGQRQRVAIGRAITRNPKVFLFDEPLSNLDASLRVQMRVEIAKLHRSQAATMIYVTHDQVEAMTLADRIAVLDRGHVMQFGAPMELYERPANRFVAGFIGSPKMNFLRCSVDPSADHTQVRLNRDLELPLPRTSVPPGDDYTLGVRPEHLVVGDGTGKSLRGEVITVERAGAETYLYVDIAEDEPLVIKTSGKSPTRAGDTLDVGIPIDACYLFDRQGNTVQLE